MPVYRPTSGQYRPTPINAPPRNQLRASLTKKVSALLEVFLLFSGGLIFLALPVLLMAKLPSPLVSSGFQAAYPQAPVPSLMASIGLVILAFAGEVLFSNAVLSSEGSNVKNIAPWHVTLGLPVALLTLITIFLANPLVKADALIIDLYAMAWGAIVATGLILRSISVEAYRKIRARKQSRFTPVIRAS